MAKEETTCKGELFTPGAQRGHGPQDPFRTPSEAVGKSSINKALDRPVGPRDTDSGPHTGIKVTCGWSGTRGKELKEEEEEKGLRDKEDKRGHWYFSLF